MPDWVIWAIAAAALAGGEVLTLGFFRGLLARGAAVAAIAGAVGRSVELQVALFVVTSVASLAFIRPIAVRHMKTPARLRSGTAALVGARAIVLERVDADQGPGKIGGAVGSRRRTA